MSEHNALAPRAAGNDTVTVSSDDVLNFYRDRVASLTEELGLAMAQVMKLRREGGDGQCRRCAGGQAFSHNGR